MIERRICARLPRASFASVPTLLAITAVLAVGPGSATAGAAGTKISFTVSGMANIWGAGLATAPDPGGSGGGVVPFDVPTPAGTATVTFSQVAGTVSYETNDSNGPDGGTYPRMNISSYGGISGLKDAKRYFYMVGVFLNEGQPTSPPSTLDFKKDHSFKSLTPQLGQVFFVGDGLRGRGKGRDPGLPRSQGRHRPLPRICRCRGWVRPAGCLFRQFRFADGVCSFQGLSHSAGSADEKAVRID